MGKIVLGDPHIEEKSLDELKLIALEVLTHDADEFICLGDYYDKRRPTPAEIEFGTWFAYELVKKYKKVTILKGNHDTLTNKLSAIDYLTYLGVNVVEEYVDDWNNFYGHFFTDKSLFEYGTHKYTVKQLEKQYNYILLGHQHNPQNISKYAYHLGSCRYVNFNEVTDIHKQIAFLDAPKRLCFTPLESPIKMFDVTTISDLEKIKENSKVRLIVSNFAQFKKEVNNVNQFKTKFKDFKIKLDFEKTIVKPEEAKLDPKDKKPIDKIIEEEIKKIEDKEIRALLEESFKED